MTNPLQQGKRAIRRFRVWARRKELSRKLAFALVGIAVALGLATVATLTGSSPIVAEARTVLYLLVLDAAVLLLLGVVVARRLYRLWQAHRRGRAGSRLHTRMVLMFSVVALTPAILVAAFSWTFLNFGFESWFNERVNTALGASRAVAQAYLTEAIGFTLDKRTRHGLARFLELARRAALLDAEAGIELVGCADIELVG